jgi:hypothetical protein
VETYDWVSRNRFVTRYAYHHGFYDGVEREFRGFGMVEQWDTEELGALSAGGGFPEALNIDAASYVPPALTKTWFHTGAFLEEGKISRQFEHEYYRESDLSEGIPGLTDADFEAMLVPDTQLPDDLANGEVREACRSLKGAILRQEVYAQGRGSALQRIGAELHDTARPAPRNQPACGLFHSCARNDRFPLRTRALRHRWAAPRRPTRIAHNDPGSRRLR